jgi:hypothetical protein
MNTPFTLICSGRYPQANLTCVRKAAWAVRDRDGTACFGACFQHAHQVMQRVAKGGKTLVVQDAASTVDACARALDTNLRHEEIHKLLDELRFQVTDTDTDTDWDPARVIASLRDLEYAIPRKLAEALLMTLDADRIVQHVSGDTYRRSADLPPYARYEPGT